ncbi:MAG: hypothetical protein ACP5RW_06250 [bacterium]
MYQEGNTNRASQTTIGDYNQAYITQIGNNNDAGFVGDSELWPGNWVFNAG